MLDILIRKELKEKFIRDLNAVEKHFFLKKDREALLLKGYQACEDLFHYCYFFTLRERFRTISSGKGGEGYFRLLLIEGIKDVEEAVRSYEESLEKGKLPKPDAKCYSFIEYFSD